MKTPSGEDAFALVLEYVKGVTLNRLAGDIFTDRDNHVGAGREQQRHAGSHLTEDDGLPWSTFYAPQAQIEQS